MEEETTGHTTFYTTLMNTIKTYRWFLIIFGLALFLRLTLLMVNIHNATDFVQAIKGDDGYFELSHNILVGNGFSFNTHPPYNPNPLRPPLYPFFLAGLLALSGSYVFTILIQILLASLTPVLAMSIAKKFFGGGWLYIIVGLLLACEPYSILMSVIFYTETLFTFLFLVFVWFLFSYIQKNTIRNLVWTAIFLVLSVLVKPTVQFLPILFPFLVMWQEKKMWSKVVLKKSLLFILIFVAGITPWLYRNYVSFGKVSMSAQPAFNLFVYYAPSLRAIDNHTSFATELQQFVRDRGVDENDITPTTSSWYTDQALKEIVKHPLAIIKLTLLSGITFFTHDGMVTVLGYAGIRPEMTPSAPVLTLLLHHPIVLISNVWELITTPFVSVLIMRFFWIVITILMLGGIWRVFRKKTYTPYHIVAILLIGYFAATTNINGLGVNARFRIPVLLFIFAFAYWGVQAVWRLSKNYIHSKSV